MKKLIIAGLVIVVAAGVQAQRAESASVAATVATASWENAIVRRVPEVTLVPKAVHLTFGGSVESADAADFKVITTLGGVDYVVATAGAFTNTTKTINIDRAVLAPGETIKVTRATEATITNQTMAVMFVFE